MTETTAPTVTDPSSTDMSLADTSSSNTRLIYGTFWLVSQLFGGVASYYIYSKEYTFWMGKNNPNNYSSGWNMWLTGWIQVFRYWYLSMFWQLGWTGISLINYIFCLMGLDSAFNIINILSIFGPLGNLALTSISYYLYSTPLFD